MRVRDAKPDELLEAKTRRALTPRQLANQKREAKLLRAISGLTEPSQIKAVEVEPGEKLATIRASVSRVIARKNANVNIAVKRGVIYLSRGPIPGTRKARKTGRGTPS
jgi:hypothetical protein